ncbi:hypothetical protein R6Q57_018361 [Mikania cordata]
MKEWHMLQDHMVEMGEMNLLRTNLIINNITTPTTGKVLSKGSKWIVQTTIRIEKQSLKNILISMEIMMTLKEQGQAPKGHGPRFLGLSH